MLTLWCVGCSSNNSSNSGIDRAGPMLFRCTPFRSAKRWRLDHRDILIPDELIRVACDQNTFSRVLFWVELGCPREFAMVLLLLLPLSVVTLHAVRVRCSWQSGRVAAGYRKKPRSFMCSCGNSSLCHGDEKWSTTGHDRHTEQILTPLRTYLLDIQHPFISIAHLQTRTSVGVYIVR